MHAHNVLVYIRVYVTHMRILGSPLDMFLLWISNKLTRRRGLFGAEVDQWCYDPLSCALARGSKKAASFIRGAKMHGPRLIERSERWICMVLLFAGFAYCTLPAVTAQHPGRTSHPWTVNSLLICLLRHRCKWPYTGYLICPWLQIN